MNPALWLQRTLCEADGTPSSRRVLFAMSVAWGLGIATGLQVKGHIDASVDLAKSIVWATAGAVAVGKFAEAK